MLILSCNLMKIWKKGETEEMIVQCSLEKWLHKKDRTNISFASSDSHPCEAHWNSLRLSKMLQKEFFFIKLNENLWGKKWKIISLPDTIFLHVCSFAGFTYCHLTVQPLMITRGQAKDAETLTSLVPPSGCLSESSLQSTVTMIKKKPSKIFSSTRRHGLKKNKKQ